VSVRTGPGGVLPSEVVAALAQAAAMQATPEALYDVIRRQTERLVDADAFYLALWDGQSGIIHFVAHHDRGETEGAYDVPLATVPPAGSFGISGACASTPTFPSPAGYPGSPSARMNGASPGRTSR